MKVLIANKFFFRNGGSEVVMFQEREFLKRNGVEVVDFSMQDNRNLDSPQASYFVTHQAYGESAQRTAGKLRSAIRLIHSPGAVKKIGAVIDAERPDIVHCHNIYHQLTPSIIGAAKRRGVPVVLTLHDYKTVCPTYLRLRDNHVCSDCLDHGFMRVVANRCADGSLSKSALLYVEAVVQKLMGSYEMVDVLLAPSRFMAESVSPRRFPVERVRLLYNGIDVDSVVPSVADAGHVLYFGRLSQEKGVHTLLEAHAMMRDKVDLVIAGTGPLEKQLKVKFPSVKYTGHITGDGLRTTIENASVVVVPSEWYENCPMSVLEAMAYGKPVIASNIGGIPELVVHGATGLLFEPGNRDMLASQISSMMGDAIKRHEYGVAGRKRVEDHFSLDKHNKSLMELYATLLQGRDKADGQ